MKIITLTDSLSLLKNLIRTPSPSREENDAATLLAGFLEQHAIDFERIGNNLVCRSPFRSDRPTVLLNAHLDTVKPVAGWQGDPFDPVERDGRIQGLGSNDCGGGLVALLQAFTQLTARPQPYNLLYAITAEEEVSGRGGIEAVLPHLPQVDVAIVGEPTQMQPAIAEKGLLVLDVTATGRAGHAARDEGDNAIYKAIKDIEWFQNYRFPKVSPLLGAVKMNVTMIQSGTQHNVVPDVCRFVVDIRSNECYTNEELFAEICRHIAAAAVPRSFRLNSSHIEADHPLVQRAVRLHLTPFGSPTLSDQALMPFPSIKLGPGKSERSHTANEYVEISEIKAAVKLYEELLDGFDLRI